MEIYESRDRYLRVVDSEQVTFGRTDSNHWRSLTVGKGHIRWAQMAGERYMAQKDWRLSSTNSPIIFELKLTTNLVSLQVNGDSLGTVEASGQVGLLVHDGQAALTLTTDPQLTTQGAAQSGP